MKSLIFKLILIGVLLPDFGIAQEEGSEKFQDGILLQQINPDSGSELQSYPLNGNTPSIGVSYKEIMEQLRSRVASAEYENYLEILQDGNENTTKVIQEGKNNAMELKQSGNSNYYDGTLQGDENLIHVLQNGHYNRLYQILEGDGMGLQVIQQGSNLELIQIETGGNSPGYQVHQKGVSMSLHIEHNQVMFPFTGGN